jgi:hypothetical protein
MRLIKFDDFRITNIYGENSAIVQAHFMRCLVSKPDSDGTRFVLCPPKDILNIAGNNDLILDHVLRNYRVTNLCTEIAHFLVTWAKPFIYEGRLYFTYDLLTYTDSIAKGVELRPHEFFLKMEDKYSPNPFVGVTEHLLTSLGVYDSLPAGERIAAIECTINCVQNEFSKHYSMKA